MGEEIDEFGRPRSGAEGGSAPVVITLTCDEYAYSAVRSMYVTIRTHTHASLLTTLVQVNTHHSPTLNTEGCFHPFVRKGKVLFLGGWLRFCDRVEGKANNV